jgi:hypothetical protein
MPSVTAVGMLTMGGGTDTSIVGTTIATGTVTRTCLRIRCRDCLRLGFGGSSPATGRSSAAVPVLGVEDGVPGSPLLFDWSSVSHPYLFPLLVCLLVIKQAFPFAASVGFAPVFYQSASAHDLLDNVSAVDCAVVIVVDIPVADPKVELVVGGFGLAGMGVR